MYKGLMPLRELAQLYVVWLYFILKNIYLSANTISSTGMMINTIAYVII